MPVVLRVTDAIGAAGEIIAVDIIAENLTDGVSGFTLTVEIVDSGIAIIDDIVFPAYCPFFFCLNDPPLPLTVPVSSITISAADLEGLIEAGVDTAILVTLNVDLLVAGSTELRILDGPELDDDPGNPMVLELIPGSISIGP